MILHTGEMMTVNMHDMGNKNLDEMTKAINDTARRANNSDMNEVMYEVSLDNTLTGLKHGKILQALRRLYGSKMPGRHQVKTLKGKAKKEYYLIPEKDRLTKHNIEQGTTTISNLGSIYRAQRGECFLLEIIPPQVSAFAVNAIQKKPIVTEDEFGSDKIEIRKILPIQLQLTTVHLTTVTACRFLKNLTKYSQTRI